MILDGTIRGETSQPSDTDLQRLIKELRTGKAWRDVFRGVAAVEVTADGAGPSLSLRITKKAGISVQLVDEGKTDAHVVALKRVDEQGYYSLGATQLAKKLCLSMPKAVVVVDYLRLRDDRECYKEFKFGSTVHKRYSPKAVQRIEEALKEEPVEEIWAKRRAKAKR